MRKLLALLILLMPTVGFAQDAADSTVTFRFVAADDIFYIPWSGNGAELERLSALVDTYRTPIAEGTMPVQVDGYCASLPTAKENLRTAFVRANRVKSELITRKGLREADFITANYAEAYDGNKDIVVVTLRIPAPAKAEPVREEPKTVKPAPAAAPEPAPAVEPQPQPEPVPEKQPAPIAEQPAAAPAPPYRFAVRTNALYDAVLLPTVGVEWRVNRDWSVKLDGSLSRWGGKHGKVQKIWLLNPEVRWYLLRDKRFYVGVSGNYGEYNLYKYALGGLFSKDTGYQGSLWSAGAVVGYQLRLSRRFSVDFNLGLGYTRSEYDSFTLDKTEIRIPGNNFPEIRHDRVYKERDKTRNCWGPTQAGISLVWTIGGHK